MSFKLPLGTREYFQRIDNARESEPKFDYLFDKYYLCLMIGLDKRRLGLPEDLESADFVLAYPQAYEGYADIIAGLLIDAELERNAISLHDQGAVESVVVNLLDPLSPTRLGADGHDLLNLYAAAGFSLIRASVYAPDELSNFLIAYANYWQL